MSREPYSIAESSLVFFARGKEAQYLREVDDELGALIDQYEVASIDTDGDGFRALARAIIDQQISIHAARSIWLRLERFCDGVISPETILATDNEDLRACGLSRTKAAAIQDLAQHVVGGHIDFGELESLDDEAVIEVLTRVRGIGRWTAQMYLIFSLSRPDVFAITDGGLRRAVEKLKGLEPGAPPELIEALAEEWAPYRTAATVFLWTALHAQPD
ncbi:MAG: DNA-3-methyladenine glycosylase 2 family protein [Coriobacteriia bacterium]|nr:DNA-3-methyladenine glycosylase 2 family protein [Coriobacteriia bacterium]MCL2870446.1 DNA-3-methyladenine glycosylase 2 family protein [Coriobacteriia bacterium]